MERERTFNPSACGSKPPGSANPLALFRGAAKRRVFRRNDRKDFGPVTVAAERRGLLTRWRTARRRFESCLVRQYSQVACVKAMLMRGLSMVAHDAAPKTAAKAPRRRPARSTRSTAP